MARDRRATIETVTSELVARQHGVLTRAQLLAAGVPAASVDARVRSRRLRPLHRGVYLHGALIGPLEPPLARTMAAVLACGPDAVLSHESAARLWGLLPRTRGAPPLRPIHVTVPGADRGRRPGIRPHRVTSLAPEETDIVEGIPVTAPARTLIDLAAGTRPRRLEQAVAEAERRELIDLARLAALLDRRGRIPGAPALRALLTRPGGPTFTRSPAEELLLGLVRRAGLTEPAVNVQVAGLEVDFLWEEEGVVVEVDGFAYHASRARFEGDRRRDLQLTARGLRVIRVTWRQLSDEPSAVLVRLAQALARAAPTGPDR